MNTLDDRNRKIAIAATAILHVAVLLILVFSYLHYHFEPLEEKEKTSEITFFGSEYVMLGDALSENTGKSEPEPVKREPEPVVADNDLHNSGITGEDSRPTVAQEKHESPMKVEKKPDKPEKSGPTKEELAEQERIKLKRRPAAKPTARCRMLSESLRANRVADQQAHLPETATPVHAPALRVYRGLPDTPSTTGSVLQAR